MYIRTHLPLRLVLPHTNAHPALAVWRVTHILMSRQQCQSCHRYRAFGAACDTARCVLIVPTLMLVFSRGPRLGLENAESERLNYVDSRYDTCSGCDTLVPVHVFGGCTPDHLVRFFIKYFILFYKSKFTFLSRNVAMMDTTWRSSSAVETSSARVRGLFSSCSVSHSLSYPWS